MTISQQQVTLTDSDLARAAVLAKVLSADPEMSAEGEWTVQDVLGTALTLGLEAMEQLHLKDGQQ